uniref:Uncharacterized protein n=1 Tax=Anopheles culicifacies TaxID=139723 RepID=A0A182MN09_9DIPT
MCGGFGGFGWPIPLECAGWECVPRLTEEHFPPDARMTQLRGNESAVNLVPPSVWVLFACHTQQKPNTHRLYGKVKKLLETWGKTVARDRKEQKVGIQQVDLVYAEHCECLV